jgi:hypothetical protein
MMGEKTTVLSHWGYKGYNNAEKHGPPRWWQYGQESRKRRQGRWPSMINAVLATTAMIRISVPLIIYATLMIALNQVGC